MKFDTPAGTNPIDRLTVVGKATSRIDGPLKTTGTAPYASDWHDPQADLAYGYVLGAGIAKGGIADMDIGRAKAAPGVLAVVTAGNAGKLDRGAFYVARPLAGPNVDHYHQVVAMVVAETFEQARAAAALIRVTYVEDRGAFDLAKLKDGAPVPKPGEFGGPTETNDGDFEGAFASAPVTLD